MSKVKQAENYRKLLTQGFDEPTALRVASEDFDMPAIVANLKEKNYAPADLQLLEFAVLRVMHRHREALLKLAFQTLANNPDILKIALDDSPDAFSPLRGLQGDTGPQGPRGPIGETPSKEMVVRYIRQVIKEIKEDGECFDTKEEAFTLEDLQTLGMV